MQDPVDSTPAVLVHRYSITQQKRAELLFTGQKEALEQYAAALCTAVSLPITCHASYTSVQATCMSVAMCMSMAMPLVLVQDRYEDCTGVHVHESMP